jgi:hypothetical protein
MLKKTSLNKNSLYWKIIIICYGDFGKIHFAILGNSDRPTASKENADGNQWNGEREREEEKRGRYNILYNIIFIGDYGKDNATEKYNFEK